MPHRGPGPSPQGVRADIHRYFRSLLDDVARCLTLFFECSVCVLGHWYQGHMRLPLVGRDSGCGATAYEHCFGFPALPRVVDEAAIRTFVEKYLAFELAQRQRLDLAIERLSIAYRTTDYRNKAIELGTVLEVLLWQDGDPNDNLSFRVRQRACILLGGSAAQRKDTHVLVGKVYDLRSKAVHGSLMFDETRNMEKIISGGLIVCFRAAREIVLVGKFPDWNLIVCGF